MRFKVTFSPHAVRNYRNIREDLKEGINKAIDEIGVSPFRGPNIKRLKGPLREYFRYRVGSHRIIYAVPAGTREVFVDYIQDRKEAYK